MSSSSESGPLMFYYPFQVAQFKARHPELYINREDGSSSYVSEELESGEDSSDSDDSDDSEEEDDDGEERSPCDGCEFC